MDYKRQMEKLREIIEKQLDMEATGTFLDEEPNKKESEEDEEGVTEEETVDEEEIADAERDETDSALQISAYSHSEETDESNDKDEH